MMIIWVLLVATCAAAGTAQDFDLKSLADAHRWTELHRAAQAQHAPALYRGVDAAVFNDQRRAERILRAVIRQSPRSEDAYAAYEWLSHLYLATGQYRKLIADMDARWAAFPNKAEEQNERQALAPFRGLPDQKTGKIRAATLPHDPATLFIPISINGSPATYFFDTGAWLNCMSESEARRLGLRIRSGGDKLGTATGGDVGFRTAVASEVSVGRLHLRDVSFAVFQDDQEPWRDLAPGRRGLVGISIIQAFRALRWERDGAMEIGETMTNPGPQRANLFFDNDHLVVAAQLDSQPICATLDTGATTTDLYEKFAKDFPALVASGTKDHTEVHGVGNVATFDSVTLPEVAFELGHQHVVLKPARVLLKQVGAGWCIGNFGMDLLKQARAFRLDLRAMTLALENQ